MAYRANLLYSHISFQGKHNGVNGFFFGVNVLDQEFNSFGADFAGRLTNGLHRGIKQADMFEIRKPYDLEW